ncbi:MAG: hypothetical protein RLZZ603_169 [Actinomycetota bacterium]|jgi:peptide/nickel transport system substrate-binding protein
MSKTKALVAVITAATIALSGVAGAQAASSKPLTLTLGTAGAAPASFATVASIYSNNTDYYQAVYDTVLRMDPSGKIIPGLATAWKFNADQTVLNLTIRKGVKFTDGTPLNAAAIVANLQRFKASSNAAAGFFRNVDNFAAPNATTVVITLTDNDPAILNYLAWNSGLIESPAAFGTATEATQPVGSGPYTLDLTKTTTGSIYTFVANPNYWDKANRPFSSVILKPFTDPVALVNALQAKQIQGAKLINNDGVAQVKAAGLQIEWNELDWSGLVISDRAGKLGSPLADVRVRQAINFAFDRNAMNQAVNGGYGTPTTQIFNPKSSGFDKSLNDVYPYNPTKAKQLLADAGYPNGFTLEIPSIAAYYGPTVYNAISDQLKAVGITVVLKEQPLSAYGAARAKYPAVFVNAEMSLNNWQLINFAIDSKSPFNFENYSTNASDKLIGRVQGSDTPAAMAINAKLLNKFVVNNAWFVPWYSKQIPFPHSSDIVVKVQAGNATPFLYSITPAKKK